MSFKIILNRPLGVCLILDVILCLRYIVKYKVVVFALFGSFCCGKKNNKIFIFFIICGD